MKTLIQYMQTAEHLSLATVLCPCKTGRIKSRNGAADDFPT